MATSASVTLNGKKVSINGKNLPAQSDLAVTWECNGKSGTVAGTAFASTCTRIDLANDVLNTLTSADEGKVKGQG